MLQSLPLFNLAVNCLSCKPFYERRLGFCERSKVKGRAGQGRAGQGRVRRDKYGKSKDCPWIVLLKFVLALNLETIVSDFLPQTQ
jgi:hypothetical protein